LTGKEEKIQKKSQTQRQRQEIASSVRNPVSNLIFTINKELKEIKSYLFSRIYNKSSA